MSRSIQLAVMAGAVSLMAMAVLAQGPLSQSTVAPRFGTWGVDLAGMDRSVRPGDDFFRFVNGTWASRTTIPADRTTYGVSAQLRELSERQVRAIIDEWSAAATLAPGSDEAKVAALYRSFLDEATVERLGAAPLRPYLDRIRAARTHEALGALMGGTMGQAGGLFFGASVYDDVKEPDRYALYLSQSGLGLADREFYLRDNFAAQAAAIVALETRLAEAHWTRAASRDRDTTYNPTTFAELEQSAPGFPWKPWAEAASVEGAPKAVVRQNTAFPAMTVAFKEAPVETLQAWQAFHTVDQAAPYLSKDFATAHWEFRSKFLQGAQEERERWKRAVSFAEFAMGEAIGRTYVARHFPPASRAKMEALVADLKLALRGRIERLDWMAPETKAAALDKLSKFGVKIGYPDEWRDYSALEVKADDLAGDVQRAGLFEWRFDADRIGKPVDYEGVVDDATDGQRLLFAGEERDCVPGGNPAAAILRSRRGSRRELRCHRRGHRP